MNILFWVGELIIGFQDVAFPPLQASYNTTFLRHCGGGKSLGTTTCLRTVAGVDKGMLPVKYVCSTKASLLSVNFQRDYNTSTMRYIWPPSVLGSLPDLKLVSV